MASFSGAEVRVSFDPEGLDRLEKMFSRKNKRLIVMRYLFATLGGLCAAAAIFAWVARASLDCICLGIAAVFWAVLYGGTR